MGPKREPVPVRAVRVRPAPYVFVVKDILKRIGFRPVKWLYRPEEGQVWNLEREWGRYWTIHVRGFEDGLVVSEVEPRRIYIEHPFYTHPVDSDWLAPLLEREGIGYEVVEVVRQGARELPKALHDWRRVVTAGGLAALLVGVGVWAWLNARK